MRNDLLISCLISVMVDDHLRMTEHSTKQVGKILILPKSTHYLALCSVNRANMHGSSGFCYGMSKETFAPTSMMKIMHFQNRGANYILGMMVLIFRLAKTSAQ